MEKSIYLWLVIGLAKEGLDVPRLDVLILASPHKDLATIIQSVRKN